METRCGETRAPWPIAGGRCGIEPGRQRHKQQGRHSVLKSRQTCVVGAINIPTRTVCGSDV